jgi:hypothetical protein
MLEEKIEDVRRTVGLAPKEPPRSSWLAPLAVGVAAIGGVIALVVSRVRGRSQAATGQAQDVDKSSLGPEPLHWHEQANHPSQSGHLNCQQHRQEARSLERYFLRLIAIRQPSDQARSNRPRAQDGRPGPPVSH